MTDLTPERRDKMRRAVTECTIPMGSTMWPVGGPTLLALLDAADERDLLAAVVNAGVLKATARDDERDRLAAAVERVRVLANGPYPHARNITGDDLTRALDGTDE